MTYGRLRRMLYTAAPSLTVASAILPDDLAGVYDDETETILIDRRMTWRRKRCTLVHELVHWMHRDPGCGSVYGTARERRCRRETALLLVDPVELATAERMYDGDMWLMGDALEVTTDILEDWRRILHGE
ncbi:ImmA/IrrE family metallo-endopeptidase [Bifidobacterium primatium]|uniref:ImmA/IrrE family metallo-endopeptidase n=1 Tax=Bifidobacterium primatium TaxID=2045438 RepID=A0A2M9H6C2_9BIFI|nr:ImmA/IrrE family metallo-endopeptidase [Bifidobacterium primatium]